MLWGHLKSMSTEHWTLRVESCLLAGGGGPRSVVKGRRGDETRDTFLDCRNAGRYNKKGEGPRLLAGGSTAASTQKRKKKAFVLERKGEEDLFHPR